MYEQYKKKYVKNDDDENRLYVSNLWENCTKMLPNDDERCPHLILLRIEEWYEDQYEDKLYSCRAGKCNICIGPSAITRKFINQLSRRYCPKEILEHVLHHMEKKHFVGYVKL